MSVDVIKELIIDRILYWGDKFAKEGDDEIGIMYESKIEELKYLLEFITTNGNSLSS